MTSDRNLEGKVALVTGASGGLGTIICKELAKNGATVIITDLNLQDCIELKNKIDRIGFKSIAKKMDVTSELSVEKISNFLITNNLNLDILINNAGSAVFTDYSARTKKEFMKIFEINTFGVFNCIQKFCKNMVFDNSSGSIINVASIYGFLSSDPSIYTDCDRNNSEIYSISKAGVIQLTKYFSIHLAKDNIRVNSISPGGVFNEQGHDFVNNYSRRVPMNRMANKNEIPGTILYLANNSLSSYVTGQNIAVDGGLSSW